MCTVIQNWQFVSEIYGENNLYSIYMLEVSFKSKWSSCVDMGIVKPGIVIENGWMSEYDYLLWITYGGIQPFSTHELYLFLNGALHIAYIQIEC